MQNLAIDLTPERVVLRGRASTYHIKQLAQHGVQEFLPHVMYFFENNLRTTPRYLNPPGYVTVPEFRKRFTSADVHGSANWDDLVSINRIVAGTPERVADSIGRWIEEAGTSRVNLNLHLGDMPAWKTEKNLTNFAEQVIPRLRSRKAVSA